MENAMRMRATSIAAASLAFGLIASSSAFADVLLAKSRVDTTNIAGADTVPLPLDEKGNTSLTFEASKKGIIVITFNAECSATGSVGFFIGLRILVDGKPTNPKAALDDFAFCAASGNDDVFTAVSRQSFINVNAGSHSVEVLVSNQGDIFGRIDDSSIVIFD